MIKLTISIKRAETVSQAEFERHWHENHAPLVRQYADLLGVVRYTQTLVRHHDALSQALEANGGPRLRAPDGMSELWFESPDVLFDAGASSEGREALAALRRDEEIFCDLSQSHFFIGEDRPIVEIANVDQLVKRST